MSPVAAIREALHDVLEQLEPHEWELEQTRWRIVAQVTDLRGALADNVGPAVQIHFEAVLTL